MNKSKNQNYTLDFNNNNVCYLCGYVLDEELDEIDKDHVPPRQFYPKKIRQQEKINLLTIPVHRGCNSSYQKDEDYFYNAIGPLAGDSPCGKLVLEDLTRSFGRPQGKRLGESVLREFDNRYSGLYLPEGKVAKYYDGKRVRRVLWKIIRGLFYKEYDRYLPEGTKYDIELIDDPNSVSDQLCFLRCQRSMGIYPPVFDYRYRSFPEKDNFHLWLFLFWQKILVLAKFLDPDDNS